MDESNTDNPAASQPAEPAGTNATPNANPTPTPTWTYPTRLCRLCFEEVPASVAMFPPGLPMKFQRPVVEYKSDDGYGRLLKPCLCRGSRRYIHELCLLRSRTEVRRTGSLWKCHECGHAFNFQRLTIQKFLASKISSAVLTVVMMFLMVIILGFVADPIINLYFDPYDTLLADEPYWREVDLYQSKGRLPGWVQHMLKGTVSMGLLGFVKTMLMNPFQWWNLRNTGFVSGRSGRAVTGRDRSVNVHWLAILIGIGSAAYLFYKWVQAIIGLTLQRIGNNVVDTHLPGDDDDLKPPAEAAHPVSSEPIPDHASSNSRPRKPGTDDATRTDEPCADIRPEAEEHVAETTHDPPPSYSVAIQEEPNAVHEQVIQPQSDLSAPGKSTESEELPSVLGSLHRQGWSFADL